MRHRVISNRLIIQKVTYHSLYRLLVGTMQEKTRKGS